jgi:hypothetical protein
MKKLIGFALIALMASSALAATGWFSDYILVSQDGGADEYYWIGDDPSFGTEFNGATFSITLGQTFELGADMKYWSDTQDRGGGAFYWTVDNFATAANEVIWTQSGPTGNDYQGLAATSANVADGLVVGSYTLTVYAKSWGDTDGDSYLNGGDNNYSATLNVNAAAVPEPATMSLLGLGALAMVLRRKIRK